MCEILSHKMHAMIAEGLFLSLVFGLVFFSVEPEPYSNEFPHCTSNQRCELKVTSTNVFGSSRYWLYGYDNKNFYSYLNPSNNNDTPYFSIPIIGVSSCEQFDQYDILTWGLCGSDFQMDCTFVMEAKYLYENGLTATLGADRYQGSERSDYNCDFPEKVLLGR